MEGVGETGGGRGDEMPSHPKLSQTGSLRVRIGKSFPGGPVSVASVFQLRTAVFGSFILFFFSLHHHYARPPLY